MRTRAFMVAVPATAPIPLFLLWLVFHTDSTGADGGVVWLVCLLWLVGVVGLSAAISERR